MSLKNIHLNILTSPQHDLLPLVSRFKRSFYLVGGTAISLQIGHRRSIDFDLFTGASFSKSRIRKVLREWSQPCRIIHEDDDQMHFLCNHVKLTFFQYPFDIPHTLKAGDFMTMPDLLTLAAMKAFALGRRAKWKDYVDLYFIFRQFTISEVSNRAAAIFADQFSEKLFREQLCYHADIDYTETVDYIEQPVVDDEVRSGLIDLAAGIL